MQVFLKEINISNMAVSPSSLSTRRAVFVRKWTGFVSAIWLMIFSGCYTFPSYSSALKEVLAIDQKLLNGLGIAKDVGDSCGGIVAGILSNYLPIWALLFISACVGFLGYGLEWLVVSQIINPLPYWVMFIAATASGSAVCWMNVAVFNASVRNFTRNRGPVAGLFKAYMGLSAAVFVAFCEPLFSNSASAYLLMLVIIPTTFSLVSSILFKPVSSAETQEDVEMEQTTLHVFNAVACGLAVYIGAIAFLPSTSKESYVYKLVAIPILIAIVVSPVLVPLVSFFKVKETVDMDVNRNGKGCHENLDIEDEKRNIVPLQGHPPPLLDDAVTDNRLRQPLLDNVNSYVPINSTSSEEKLQSKFGKQWSTAGYGRSFWGVEDLGEDKPTLSLLKSWHFYVFYFSLFCGCGSGVTFSNNLGQVGQSLGFTDADLFASLFSLGNFFGRIASGNCSEYFLRAMGMPRPMWMGLTKVPMISLFLWLSTGSMTSLYVGSPVLGFCHGSLVTLTVPIVSEFYGLKHFGTNFTLTSTYFLTGSYAFSSIAGYLYDKEAEGLTCVGAKCYAVTFRILASCLTIALACDAILTLISRPLYQKLKAINFTFEPKSNNSHQ